MAGTPSRTATASGGGIKRATSVREVNAPTARGGGKEAAGKTPTRGTRSVYEAFAWWARGRWYPKPDAIQTGGRRYDGNGAKVTRLTLGDLSVCAGNETRETDWVHRNGPGLCGAVHRRNRSKEGHHSLQSSAREAARGIDGQAEVSRGHGSRRAGWRRAEHVKPNWYGAFDA